MPVSPARARAVRDVFDGVPAHARGGAAIGTRHRGGDSRLVFLPLPLVLRPPSTIRQAEIDALVARAQGTPFTRGNRVLYMTGQQFQPELLRTIHETEDYHVLWLHDYGGGTRRARPTAWGSCRRWTATSAALTDRVREFDATLRLPVFMILLDQKYYEPETRPALHGPARGSARSPAEAAGAFRRAAGAGEPGAGRLRQAVSGSRRLQAGGPARAGLLRRLRQGPREHHQSRRFSPTARAGSWHLPIAPDTVIRDHRKIAFRDVTEADPGRGEALYAGVGVGEQYASATWDDRASAPAVPPPDAEGRGPAYLLQNGFSESDPRSPCAVAPPRRLRGKGGAARGPGATAIALEVHNDRGFARKDASVVNSMLYPLMPPGA